MVLFSRGSIAHYDHEEEETRPIPFIVPSTAATNSWNVLGVPSQFWEHREDRWDVVLGRTFREGLRITFVQRVYACAYGFSVAMRDTPPHSRVCDMTLNKPNSAMQVWQASAAFVLFSCMTTSLVLGEFSGALVMMYCWRLEEFPSLRHFSC